jgi:hypothetical protein
MLSPAPRAKATLTLAEVDQSFLQFVLHFSSERCLTVRHDKLKSLSDMLLQMISLMPPMLTYFS